VQRTSTVAAALAIARAILEEALAVTGEPLPPDGADAPSEPARAGKPVAATALTTLAQIRAAAGDVTGALSASRRAMSILAHLGALEEGEGLVRLVCLGDAERGLRDDRDAERGEQRIDLAQLAGVVARQDELVEPCHTWVRSSQARYAALRPARARPSRQAA